MANKKAASLDHLGSLHNELAKVLTKAITEGVNVVDKDGNVANATCPAAILNCARQFLKDNGVEAIPAEGSPLGDLQKAALPDFDEYGNEVVSRPN